MRLIESSAEKVVSSDPIITAEIAGRTCYKSESPYTLESAFKFLSQCCKRGHMTVLEHAVFSFLLEYNDEFYFDERFAKFTTTKALSSYGYAIVTINLRTILEKSYYFFVKGLIERYGDLFVNAFPKTSYGAEFENKVIGKNVSKVKATLINLKNFLENTDIGKELSISSYYIIGNQVQEHYSNSVKVVCDRGVSHELVRHRLFSFCQESTRYCNYSKDKFGKELTFIRSSKFDSLSGYDRAILIDYYTQVEKQYMSFVENGMKPEIARQILPNALKTELVVTGYRYDWEHFFDLRLRGITGKPHPDMKDLAEKISFVL